MILNTKCTNNSNDGIFSSVCVFHFTEFFILEKMKINYQFAQHPSIFTLQCNLKLTVECISVTSPTSMTYSVRQNAETQQKKIVYYLVPDIRFLIAIDRMTNIVHNSSNFLEMTNVLQCNDCVHIGAHHRHLMLYEVHRTQFN